MMTQANDMHENFKRKVEAIGKNMETTKKFKYEIENIVDILKTQIEETERNNDENVTRMKGHIDNIALKFAENTVDLTSAGEGF